MSGPEVCITCDECRKGFDAEPAICASCFKDANDKIAEVVRLRQKTEEELDEALTELDGARNDIQLLHAKNDELQRTINRLLEEVHARQGAA